MSGLSTGQHVYQVDKDLGVGEAAHNFMQGCVQDRVWHNMRDCKEEDAVIKDWSHRHRDGVRISFDHSYMDNCKDKLRKEAAQHCNKKLRNMISKGDNSWKDAKGEVAWVGENGEVAYRRGPGIHIEQRSTLCPAPRPTPCVTP